MLKGKKERDQGPPSARLASVMREVAPLKDAAAQLLAQRDRFRADAATKREQAKTLRSELIGGAGDDGLRQAREAQVEAEILEETAREIDQERLPAELIRCQGSTGELRAAIAGCFDVEAECVRAEIKKLHERHIRPLELHVMAFKRAARMVPDDPSITDGELAATLAKSPEAKAIAEQLGGAAALLAEFEALENKVDELCHELKRREAQAPERLERRASF